MSAIQAIAFDKDGTLFDFAKTWEAWAQSLMGRLAGGDARQAARLGTAVGFDVATASFDPDSLVIAGTPDEIVTELAPLVSGYDRAGLLALLNEEAERAPQVETVPLAPFLEGLRRSGFRLGVVTNDAEGPALAHLTSAGVRLHFDFVAGSDSGFGAKPAPGQLHAFAEAMEVAPAACVMVGDSLHDLHAGRAAGMRTVGVLTGYASAAQLSPFADVVLDDIGSLPDWLSDA